MNVMKRLLLIAVFILVSESPLHDAAEGFRLALSTKEMPDDESRLQKYSGKSSAKEPYMDGVVSGKGMELAKNGSGEILYVLYVKTNKGQLKKFRTTENNYNILEKGYSVHYVLTASGMYKLIRYRAPD